MDNQWRHTVEAFGHFQLARHEACDLSIGNYFVNEFSAFQIECQGGCSIELFSKAIIECDLFYRSLLFGLG
jgi:hypothetical protein